MATKQKVQFSTVDQYIALQPEHARIKLEQLRETIKKAVPAAEEVISYQMPAYKLHGMIAWMAGTKNHYALYIRPGIMKNFKDELASYGTTKSAIHFPYDKPVPRKLVTAIVKYSAKINLENTKAAKR